MNTVPKAIFSVFMIIVGMIYCYKQNGGALGTHFIQKYIILSWILVCRMGFVFVMIFLVLAIVSALIPFDFLTLTESDFYAIGILLSLIFFFLLGKHIRQTHTPRLENISS